MRKKIEAILLGGHVRRYHSTPVIHNQTVGHHTFGVASFLVLMGVSNHSLLVHALWHDLAEAHVGDLPAPIKRRLRQVAHHNNLPDSVKQEEDTYLNHVGLKLPELTEEEHRYLKMADCFDGMLHCIYERMMGNQTVSKIYWKFRMYAGELNPIGRSADIFMELSEMWRSADGRE